MALNKYNNNGGVLDLSSLDMSRIPEGTELEWSNKITKNGVTQESKIVIRRPVQENKNRDKNCIQCIQLGHYCCVHCYFKEYLKLN